MPRTFTPHYLERSGNTSGEAPVCLLEIEHAQLAQPVRVVCDTDDIVSNGDTYTAFAFQITLPTDLDNELPRAQLVLDNVGRELVQWIDSSFGGQGATVRAMQVMRDDPDTLEFDMTLDLLAVQQNVAQISAGLGFDDTLNKAGLPIRYSPDVAPGLY